MSCSVTIWGYRDTYSCVKQFNNMMAMEWLGQAVQHIWRGALRSMIHPELTKNEPIFLLSYLFGKNKSNSAPKSFALRLLQGAIWGWVGHILSLQGQMVPPFQWLTSFLLISLWGSLQGAMSSILSQIPSFMAMILTCWVSALIEGGDTILRSWATAFPSFLSLFPWASEKKLPGYYLTTSIKCLSRGRVWTEVE